MKLSRHPFRPTQPALQLAFRQCRESTGLQGINGTTLPSLSVFFQFGQSRLGQNKFNSVLILGIFTICQFHKFLLQNYT